MKRILALGALILAVSACRHLFGRPTLTVSPAAATPVAAEAPSTGLLDINHATGTDLCRLPGVGPVMAGKILRLRAQLRGFDRIDQLLLAPGMSERKLRRIAPLLRVTQGS